MENLSAYNGFANWKGEENPEKRLKIMKYKQFSAAGPRL
jgi:hypothetical protein